MFADDGRPVNVGKLQIVSTGKMIQASAYGSAEANRPALELNEEEQKVEEQIRNVWQAILSSDVDKSTDFFYAGAGSMDVTRLVEEVKDIVGDSLE